MFAWVLVLRISPLIPEASKSAYSDIEIQRFSDTGLLVAEQKTDYVKNNPIIGRKEFDELTKDEVDKLAEYALFLKSQRGRTV